VLGVVQLMSECEGDSLKFSLKAKVSGLESNLHFEVGGGNGDMTAVAVAAGRSDGGVAVDCVLVLLAEFDVCKKQKKTAPKIKATAADENC
jgi:hypothetical protein